MGVGNSQKGGSPRAQKDVSTLDLILLASVYSAALIFINVWVNGIKPMVESRRAVRAIERKAEAAPAKHCADTLKIDTLQRKTDVQAPHFAQNALKKNVGQGRFAHAPLPFCMPPRVIVQKQNIAKYAARRFA